MNELISTPHFKKGYKQLTKKYPAFKQKLDDFLEALTKNPFQGAEPFPNVRKIRLSIEGKNKGKSGGARVIIYVRIEKEQIYGLYLYDKSEIADIPDHEIKDFVKELLDYFDEEDEEKKE